MRSKKILCPHVDEEVRAIDPPTQRFVRGLVDDYFAARRLMKRHDRITRGISRIVSSLAEERLAHWLIETFGDRIDHLYVDQDLRVDNKLIGRPDVAVTTKSAPDKASAIRMLIDVKMDLGHCRDTTVAKEPVPAGAGSTDRSLAGKARNLMRSVLEEGHPGVDILSSTDPDTKKTRTGNKLRIAPDCVYVFFVISGTNIGVAKRAEVEQRVNCQYGDDGRIRMITMFPHSHANDRNHADANVAETRLTRDLACGTFEKFRELVDRAIS